MATITKKIWPEYFEAIKSGKKKFELRLNDFDIQEGDLLELVEWDPVTKNYTGESITKKVTYVFKAAPEDLEKFYPINDIEEKGIQVISLE
jgi:ASC-1-like (ASCH) protein